MFDRKHMNRDMRRVVASGLPVWVLLLTLACGGSQGANNNQGLDPPPAPSQINSYFGTSGDIWSTKIDHTANQVNAEDRTIHGIQLGGSIIGTFDIVSGFLNVS